MNTNTTTYLPQTLMMEKPKRDVLHFIKFSALLTASAMVSYHTFYGFIQLVS